MCLAAWTDIATAQPSLQSHLVPLRAQTLIQGQVLSNPWKSSQLPTRLNFHVGHLETLTQGGKLQIRAVATLEPKCSVPKEDGRNTSQLGRDSSPSSTQLESLKSGDSDEEPDEREKLRRMRISKANKGNTPWNKGRKHSAGKFPLIDLGSCTSQSVSILFSALLLQFYDKCVYLYLQKPFNG